jgi:hypothetical protein
MRSSDTGEPQQIIFMTDRAGMLFLKAQLIIGTGLAWYDFERPFFTAAFQLTSPPLQCIAASAFCKNQASDSLLGALI